MNLDSLTFCSATIIMNSDKEIINDMAKKHNLTQQKDISEKQALFFDISDLMNSKDTNKLFKIIFDLILIEEKKINKLFPNIESMLDQKNLKNYLFKENVDLKFLSLCYYYLKLKNFENYDIDGEIGKLFSCFYIVLTRKILTESFAALLDIQNEAGGTIYGDVDYENVSKKLYNDLKNIKESNVILASENKKLTKVNKSNIKEIEKLNKEVLNTKNYIEDTIKKNIEGNNKELIEAFKNTKYDVLDNTYKSTLDKLVEDLSQSRADGKILAQKNHVLAKENNELKEKIDSFNSNSGTIEEKKYEKLDDSKNIEKKVEVTKLYNNQFVSNHIVWCKGIENMIGIKSDGSKITITDIPATTYIRKGDFMLVSNQGKFLRSLDAFTDKDLYPNLKFAMITEKHGRFYVCKDVTGEMIEINYTSMKATPRANMIVGLDSKDDSNIKIVFKRSVHLLNDYKTIINIKKQRALYILKILSKGYLVRNCFTNEEEFINMFIKNAQEGDLIIVDENNNYLTMLPSQLYLNSPLNIFKNYYTISIKQDNLYGINQDGSTVLLNNFNVLEVADGDLVAVDEFRNIIYLVDSMTKERVFSKKNNKTKTITSDQHTGYLGDILIIGNIGFANNYSNSFKFICYKTETVDGFDSYTKISFNLEKFKYIICVTSHCSHDNMFKLKKEGLDNIIFTNNNGSNQLVNELNKFVNYD